MSVEETTLDDRPLIAHVIFRLGVGGLENGVVNLVNSLPEARFRHVIVCLQDFDDFRDRIKRNDVEVVALHKREGQDLGLFWRLFKLFRRLQPAVVHTRNLGCMEAQIPAFFARVPGRIHSEHGWDTVDPHGNNRKYQILRRLLSVLVKTVVPLSRELESYLVDRAGISAKKIQRIYNGVDVVRFQPTNRALRQETLPEGFADEENLVIGTVGRMHGVKDQMNLALAFAELCELLPEVKGRLRLVFIGDGPLRSKCQTYLNDLGLGEQCWLPGKRSDIPAVLGSMDVFVLPSLAEGISNTILEAMATGLPVVATAVGGNLELVVEGETGRLVPAQDPKAMATALASYVSDQQLIEMQGQAGRKRIEESFSLSGMMARYADLYQQTIGKEEEPVAEAAG